MPIKFTSPTHTDVPILQQTLMYKLEAILLVLLLTCTAVHGILQCSHRKVNFLHTNCAYSSIREYSNNAIAIRMSSDSTDFNHQNYGVQPDSYNTVATAISSTSPVANVIEQLRIVWDFTRPHTIVGSGISIVCLFMYAVPPQLWFRSSFNKAMISALLPSLFMNLYITGLNQVTDVDIDKINKPYLPIAAGRLSVRKGRSIVIISLILALVNIRNSAWPLQMTLLGSALLGTVYSLPPFRLKRFPLLAAVCILVVRGSLVNLGFFLQAKATVLSNLVTAPSLHQLLKRIIVLYPECAVLTSFFAVFGVVIALMKDVPDIRGDLEYRIPSFSVKMGASRVFRFSWQLLFWLLSGAASLMLATVFASLSTFQSTIATPIIQRIVTRGPVSQLVRATLSFIVGISAFDLRKRARNVEANDPDKVFDFYMYVWNIFYGCYLLLPFMRI